MSDQSETVISWRAIGAHAPVITSDGAEIGHVSEVAALAQEDIFHGVVITHRLLGHHFLIPAADISRITDRAVYLKTSGPAVEAYDRFHEMHVKRVGLRGVFGWKHLGWKDASE